MMHPGCRAKFWKRAALAMMLGLTLCSGGCVNSALWRNHPLASVSQGPHGNAVLATLPSGTRIHLPNEESARTARALFGGEALPESADSPCAVVLHGALRICTTAYIEERDLQELALLQQIERLNQENTQLRFKP